MALKAVGSNLIIHPIKNTTKCSGVFSIFDTISCVFLLLGTIWVRTYIFSSALIISDTSFGNIWEYVLSVCSIFLCPKCFDTATMLTPSDIKREAQECLKSCRRIFLTPASAQAFSNTLIADVSAKGAHRKTQSSYPCSFLLAIFYILSILVTRCRLYQSLCYLMYF